MKNFIYVTQFNIRLIENQRDTEVTSPSIDLGGEKQSKERRSKTEAKLNVIEEEHYQKDLYQKATRTTITGGVKNAIYLQKKQLFEEYNKAVDLCQQGNVTFTEELLRRGNRYTVISSFKHYICRYLTFYLENNLVISLALLEPFDKPMSSCKEDMRQSGTDLISYNQLMGTKKKNKKITRTKLTGIERIYPPKRCIATGKVLMKLSTGIAAIQSKTDCWMTFEEFQNIIK